MSVAGEPAKVTGMALRKMMAVWAGRRRAVVPAAALGSSTGFGKASKPDRRAHERYISVLRLGKLSDPQDEFVLIRNISAGGMRAEIFSHRKLGERLTIDLGNQDPLSGRVVWTGEDAAGVAFDEKIDIRRALARVAPPGKRRARAPRVKVDMSISVVQCHSRTSCLLIDISQGGGKIKTDAPLKVGDELTLEIRGFGKVIGTVRWVRDGVVGTAFPFQLPYRKLASWVAMLNQQRGPA
jgi:hypothetical protein